MTVVPTPEGVLRTGTEGQRPGRAYLLVIHGSNSPHGGQRLHPAPAADKPRRGWPHRDRRAALSWTRDPQVAAWFALQSRVRAIRRATLAATDVATYFRVAIIGATPPRDERDAAAEERGLGREGLTEIAATLRGWVTEKSDEFITTAVLDSVPLDEDEAQDLMAKVAL